MYAVDSQSDFLVYAMKAFKHERGESLNILILGAECVPESVLEIVQAFAGHR